MTGLKVVGVVLGALAGAVLGELAFGVDLLPVAACFVVGTTAALTFVSVTTP